MNRANRALIAKLMVMAAAALAAGCATSPPTRWYQLPIDAPAPAQAAPAAAATVVWELSNRIAMPGAADRDAMVLASHGGAQLQPLAGDRWSEPLRDGVPRVLLHDLELLRGRGSVWLAPAPTGVAVQQQLRVELQALQAEADQRRLRLVARWWLVGTAAPAGPVGAAAPQAMQADISVAMAGTSPEAIVSAHRAALWQLAQQISAAAPR